MARGGVSAKGAARRDEILDIAMRMLSERGYQHTSLRAIARTLGVEPAHILYYFGSREELLLAVVQQWLAGERPDGEKHGGSWPPPEERLDDFVATVNSNASIPGIVKTYLALSAEAADPGHVAHDFFLRRFAEVRARLAEAVVAEQRSGRARPEIDPDQAARGLIAVADGIQLQWLIDPSTDVTGELAAVVASLRVPDGAGR
jgi:AcrR family transcriptional regulator